MKIVSFFPRWLIWAAPLVALAAGCARNKAAPAARAGGGSAVPVQVAVAVQRDVPRRIESIGTVQALRTVSV
jgi:multidrug efflux pump subunit AcrA (membrane-fusion protein)